MALDVTRGFVALLLAALLPLRVAAVDVVTLTAPESANDPRTAYNMQLIRLALEKTRASAGDFEIRLSPPMNTARAMEDARVNALPNLLVMTTFENRLLDEGFDYARFPVDFGVTGYRICFVSPASRDAVSQAKTLDALRNFTIGQGRGWADVAILRHNAFKVEEVGAYESLFSMVASNRFDLFCRGINELEPELKVHAHVRDLDYDRSFALSYPLPRFFFSSKKNAAILRRITEGLQIAWADGSMRKLWLAQYKDALLFAQLGSRRVFHLQTPDIDRIDFDYQRYYFNPSRALQ
ncbi:hypothetical protein GCM10025771_42340 [Niveibacterium umoris]|uniref:Solute-binding protein family 3/N-terminal domain-containing protein n=1 Tax=Niveibacterium umoris TaxID=1193620 RepID=A0A840BWT3_9RHOO|nr:hypothetical protein [Niveibacterium umoris]MBB4014767.1 hypothetical protein [Niveibacterium umoris]